MSRASAATRKGKRKGLSIDEKAILVERWMAAHPQPYTLKELQQLIPKHTPVIYQSVEECVQLLVAEGRIEEDRVGVSTLLWRFPPTAAQLASRSSRQPGRSGGRGSSSANSAAASLCPMSYAELLRRLTASGAEAQRQQQQVSTEMMERWCALTPHVQLREWHDMLQAENERAMASLAQERERLGFLDNSGNGEQDSEDASASEAAVLAELARLQQLALQRAQLLAEHKSMSSRHALPEVLDHLNRASFIALEAANRWTDNYYLAEEEVVGKAGFGGSRRDVREALQLPLDLSYLSDESDAESNIVGGHERQEVGGCNSFHLSCTPAHDAAPQPSSPLQHGSNLCDAGRPSSTQNKQPLITVPLGSDAVPVAHADVRGSDPAPAAVAAPSLPGTDAAAPLSTAARPKKAKTAKPPGSCNMPGPSSLELSAALEQRILAASSVLRLTPDAFLIRLLSQHYNTLGGLPRDLLRYILTFLDYSTISATLTRVCRLWQDCVLEDPLHFFSRLRQMHGIHLLDPVHGLFYFPRALKRVAMDSRAGASSPPSVAIPAASSSSTSSGMAPASSFLTVDIRTQNTKSLPWGHVREAVQWAIAGERMVYGEVRSPGLQQSEDPVWSQAAIVAYDRRIYMFGGETYEGVVLDRAYEYDPMTRHWGVLPALSEKRAAASAVAYAGHIFVFGGYNTEGGVLDTYEVLEVKTRTWASQTRPPHNGHARRTAWFSGAAWPFSAAPPPEWTGSGGRSAVLSQYRMPEKVCGTAVTVHGDVFLFAGGHQSCIAPEQTAVSYSAVNSTVNTPQRLPRAASISVGGQPTAESFVWIFCPRTGRWWTHGPRLPSPRAFGAVAVLELPVLGPCLCYFGGCAKADTPETAMFYIPLCAAAETRALADADSKDCADDAASRSPDASSPPKAAVAKAARKRQDVTGGEGSDAAQSPGATAATTVTGRRLRRTAATLTGEEDAAGAESRREAAGAQGAVRKGYRGARAAPVAAVGSDGVAHTDPSDAERGATGAPFKAATGESEGSGSCGRRTAHERLQVTPTTRVPSRYLHHSGVECVRNVSRRVANADAGSAFGSGGDDGGAVLPGAEADTTMIWRCFRNPKKLPWQRYVRIPIGGAFTSVVVLGAQHSRSLVLTGFYPAPSIGYCKVNHLLPHDAFLPLLGALSSPLSARADTERLPPIGQDVTVAHARGNTPLPPTSSPPSNAAGSPPDAVRAAAAASSFPTLQLNPSLHDEAAVAVNRWHQEQEWNHHQRQEIREIVRSAAHAATMRHPRNPQTAGEEHKWNLAPVPEVRVASLNGTSLLRVSWKVQTLNAKVIVGIE
ncbi:Mnd1 family protein [Leishmania donovani]|uniref:Mnd1 family protein n=1 Tax=Leishmania donovani TaxID=5661 RepID=A0A504XU56_LEIDO|nr:Mnd1 family protein [Leishmania donovani]